MKSDGIYRDCVGALNDILDRHSGSVTIQEFKDLRDASENINKRVTEGKENYLIGI